MRYLVQLSGIRRPAVLCVALVLCAAASAHAQQTAVKAPTKAQTQSRLLRIAEYGSPPVAAQIPRYRLVPETQAEKQSRLWGNQFIVGPRVSYGACWFASGLEDDNGLEAASCTSVGAYFVKGFHQYFAFEVEAVGVWTGDARFEDAQGGLTRSATLGRFAAHGVARLAGGKTVPYVRMGAGVQGISYDSQVSMGGTSTDGPDDSLEFTSFFTLGGGVQTRIGNNIIAGFAISYMSAIDIDYRSLDVGIHIGYGWNP